MQVSRWYAVEPLKLLYDDERKKIQIEKPVELTTAIAFFIEQSPECI